MLLHKSPNKYISLVLILYLVIFLISFPVINRLNILFYVVLTSSWLVFLLLCYLVLYRNDPINYSKYFLIIGAIIGLILNLTSSFSLSDDIYRYLFDGFLVQKNINPYLYAPTSPSISLIANNFPFLGKINNASVPSPYPPLMILLSFLFVSLFGYNLMVWLFFINILWVATGYVLIKILKVLGMNSNYILLWLNPLVLLVFDSSGHNDMIALFFLSLSLYFLVKSKSQSKKLLIVSGVFLSLSIGIKLFPIFFVPFLIKKLKLGFYVTIVLTGIQFLMYYLLINVQTSGIVIFLEYWRGNGGLFEIVYLILNSFNSNTYITELQYNIRVIFAILFCITLVLLSIVFYRRTGAVQSENDYFISMFQFIGYGFIALLIFSPVIHPWYTLWPIFPFIFTTDKKFYPYWLFVLLNSYTYVFYLYPSYFLQYILVEYILFYSALLIYFIVPRLKLKRYFQKVNDFQLSGYNSD